MLQKLFIFLCCFIYFVNSRKHLQKQTGFKSIFTGQTALNISKRGLQRNLKSFSKKSQFIVPFDFYTYCPQKQWRRAFYDHYRVSVIAQNLSVQDPSDPSKITYRSQLLYCGKARLRGQTCLQAKVVCTSPGPTFDLRRGRKIKVQWINQINSVNDDFSTRMVQAKCPENAPHSDHCYLTSVLKNNVTFPSTSPTHLVPGSYGYTRLSTFNVPISTHIHGLQIPPYYDGNPTSWFTKKGDRGTGAIYAQSNSYVSAYINQQNPGTLWYHDHAMHVTDHNVRAGLVGLWLIRDPNVEKHLPHGPLEQLFILSKTNQTYVSNIVPRKRRQRHVIRKNPLAKVLQTYSADGYLHLSRDVHRIRMLNAWYDIQFEDLHFNVTDPSGKQIGRLSFTIIGVDSSLMKTPIHNVNSISIASAQRFDLLFDLRAIPAGSIIQLIAAEQTRSKETQAYIKIKIDNRREKRIYNGDYNIYAKRLPNIGFRNLTSFKPSVTRFRPLIASVIFQFSINSHPVFEKAESEDPIIGSVQDWIFINTMNFSHPIHVHLINYQLIARYKLKYIVQGLKSCTLYSLAYYGIDPNNPMACSLSQPIDYSIYTNKFLQNDPNSVLDVYEGCSSKNQNATGCKYLESLKSLPIPNWEKNWKQTSLVRGFTTSVIRIRWAKTDYSALRDQTRYFSYPNEQITAFPGYVYHCHFLPHEDSSMMRPILLREK